MSVCIILVPYDSGVFDARMGRGPQAIMLAGLERRLEQAGHDHKTTVVRVPDTGFATEISTSFALQREVAAEVSAAIRVGAVPLVISGNCNPAVGTVSGLRAEGVHPAVCWFDAHADFNTPDTSASGFLDGMALSMLTGDCWSAMTAQQAGFAPVATEDVLMFGTRDVDIAELERMHVRGIQSFDTEAIRRGFHRDPLRTLGTRCSDVYLHIDLDVLDPSVGRANSYAAPRGLSTAALSAAVDDIAAIASIRAVALTAYDPYCDPEGGVATAAVELAARIGRATWQGGGPLA